MTTLHNVLIFLTILLYLLGRLCDDLGWHSWNNISTDALEAIAVGALAASASITIARRFCEQDAVNLLFWHSQLRFVIPWALVALICFLLFNIFGCQPTLSEQQTTAASYYMDRAGCILYTVVIALTNLNYSLLCNIKGDLPIVVVCEITLFAEIIYNGTLLIKLIGELEGQPKDYSILFISIFIAWQMLVMDLLFRGAYEEREKHQKHKQLENLVKEHQQVCEHTKNNQIGTERMLREGDKKGKTNPYI